MESFAAFYAYPAEPSEIGQTIENTCDSLRDTSSSLELSTWRALNTVGYFIRDQVLERIDNCDLLAADITRLNFNVTYEIGYAIGRQKRVLLTKNISLTESAPTIREVGIFDTIGYRKYQNSAELISFFTNIQNVKPIDIPTTINQRAPVYLLDTKHKTDWATRIVSRIKKARYIFRTFDPNEMPRLSAHDAIAQVAQSHGVVVPLLSATTDTWKVHNLRAAFIAGLAEGMNKAIVMIQNGDEPVPIDYRDWVRASYHPDDINDFIAEFAARVAESFQKEIKCDTVAPPTFLQSLDLGATSAENEMRSLQNYYLNTEQFLRSLRGEAHLVVGRKGSGKSAIFLQIRDRERNKNGNIVLDLKPEGYKLIKLKERILDYLEEGTFQHTIMAFWEYVLLLEICQKILEKDHTRHVHDHELFEPYRRIAELYKSEGYITEGDFSERITSLIEKISTSYQAKYGGQRDVRLSVPEVTELLYSHDVRELMRQVAGYMRLKGKLWLLFDNIDKGWPTLGLQHEDLIIIRTLIDATRKLERQLSKDGVEVNTVIFLRNDVYELLVQETSDRGKEANVLLDWTDPDLLRELLRLRIVSNNLDPSADFEHVWPRVCVSHCNGEESSQYLIERSLMRPRFLLNLINQCKSVAVNLNHSVIQAEDIEKGLCAYSTDLLTDIGYEIQDVAPESGDVLYAFIGCKANLSEDKVWSLLDEIGMPGENREKIRDLLLWYGFLGIQLTASDTKYIYDLNYNMKLLKGFYKKHRKSASLAINPAFWPALMIEQ